MKFITNNIHWFVIAALVLAGFAVYKINKSEKADKTEKVTETAE